MRGSQSIFTNMFEEAQKVSVSRQRKGRSNVLHNARNEALIARYYFYCKFFENKLNYDYIISKLATEFYLSTVTIPEIITANTDKLSELKKEQPALKFFKEKWPYMVW